ncbi:hypothetical protein [Poriferisphaera sp. WC338]|uniref:hypothetical protein n=1 Tax=Poriferisphaera sp. WC338 TaxID=3425129 RepID=UPI003D815EC1
MSTQDDKPYESLHEIISHAWQKWLVGIVGAAFLIYIGTSEIFTQHATLYFPTRYNHYSSHKLTGLPAVTQGFAMLFFAITIHVYYYWRHHNSLCRYFQPLATIFFTLFLIAEVATIITELFNI